jgi:GxxExxY protein
METGMIYEDKSQILRGGLFEVQNEVGLGRSEELYHQAFREWLISNDIPYVSKLTHEIQLDGDVVHVLYPDFVAWDCITVEMKALGRRLRDEERVQIHNYLKRRGDKLGLLVNMGLDRVQVERIAYDAPAYLMAEDWNAWDRAISGEVRDTGHSLHQMIQSIFQQHHTGYGSEIVEKLVLFGLNKSKLPVVLNPSGVSHYRGNPLGESRLDCLVVNGQILVTLTALFDDNEFNIHRAQSFMTCLGLNWGLAINFGKKSLQINALSSAP